MADNLLFFTELMGMPVLDLKGRRIGRIKDAALVPLDHASRIDRYLVGGGDAWLSVRHDQIAEIGLETGIRLSDEQLIPYHEDNCILRIARDLLDQQIIDVTGRKVVKVNDLTMEIRDESGRSVLHLVEVDIGLRSVLRRLMQGGMPRRWIRWLQGRSTELDPLGALQRGGVRPTAAAAARHKLREAGGTAPGGPGRYRGGAEPGRTRGDLRNHRQRSGGGYAAEIEPKMQASILESLEPEKAADIVEEMAPDEAADASSGTGRED